MDSSQVLEREYTIADNNDDLWAAIDVLNNEKSRRNQIAQSQQMGYDMQRNMHKNNPAQLKMLDNQISLADQMLRRAQTQFDTKIRLLNRLLDEKKVHDQELLEKGLEEVQNDVLNLKVETSSLAGQINLLKKEAQERKKDFDSQIDDIRTKAADQKTWTEDIYSQVYTLQANSHLLMAEYDEKQKNLREKQYIDADPNTSAVYSTVFSKMNEVFIASKSIASGMVSRAAYSKGDTAASYITLAGSLIPFPAVSAVMGYVAKGVQYLSDKREEERINNITGNALGFSEMDEICDWIARGIVFAYEEQIRALKTEAATTFAECCVAYILDFMATKDSDRANHLDATNETIVVHIDESSQVSSVATIPSISQDPASALSPKETLVSDLLIYMSRRTGVKNGKFGLTDVKLETRIPGVILTDRGIIKQSGLRTAVGVYYHGAPITHDSKAHRVPKAVAPAAEPHSAPSSRTPTPGKPPAMVKSPSKYFNWGGGKGDHKVNVVKSVEEVANVKNQVQGTVTSMSLKTALNAQEKIGSMLTGDEPCRPDIHGYRFGTAREAVLLGMIEAPVRVASKIVPLTAEQIARDPNSQSKFWTGK